jgi:hypothetical protein
LPRVQNGLWKLSTAIHSLNVTFALALPERQGPIIGLAKWRHATNRELVKLFEKKILRELI